MDPTDYYVTITAISITALIVSFLSYSNSKKAREESKEALELKYKPSIELNYKLGSYDKALFEFHPVLTLFNTGETTLTIDNLDVSGDLVLTNGDAGKYSSVNKAEDSIVLNAGQSQEIDFNININGSNINAMKLFINLSAKNTKGCKLNINNRPLLSEKFIPRDFL
jgi:hypothetical protein